MSAYTGVIGSIEERYKNAQDLKVKVEQLQKRLDEEHNEYVVMLEAQRLLATVSDKNTQAVLGYMTGVINKALSELFPQDRRRIYLERTMHAGQYAHINIKLTGTGGRPRDLTLQSGTGLRQIISFLFVLSLIEIRKGRRIILMDEILSGLHPKAKSVVVAIMKIFAEEGFQFVMVEYGIDSFGRIYLVEKPNEVATVTPLDKKVYNNEVFVFNRPPEDVDLSLIVDEEVTEDETVGA